MNRPATGLEKKKIERGVTEGERIDTARLLANAQGKLDERFCLACWLLWRNPIKQYFLRRWLRPYFEMRTKESPDYGMNWNDCEI